MLHTSLEKCDVKKQVEHFTSTIRVAVTLGLKSTRKTHQMESVRPSVNGNEQVTH